RARTGGTRATPPTPPRLNRRGAALNFSGLGFGEPLLDLLFDDSQRLAFEWSQQKGHVEIHFYIARIHQHRSLQSESFDLKRDLCPVIVYPRGPGLVLGKASLVRIKSGLSDLLGFFLAQIV